MIIFSFELPSFLRTENKRKPHKKSSKNIFFGTAMTSQGDNILNLY